MQKSARLKSIISGILLIGLVRCVSHDFPQYVCTKTYSFAKDIKPIIDMKCAVSGCHNGDMGPNLNWTNFEMFHQRAASGLVKYRVINHIMPPSWTKAGPLSQEQIDAIACWTDQGALNN